MKIFQKRIKILKRGELKQLNWSEFNHTKELSEMLLTEVDQIVTSYDTNHSIDTDEPLSNKDQTEGKFESCDKIKQSKSGLWEQFIG